MKEIMTARNAILEDLKRRFKEGDKRVQPNKRFSTPYGNEDTTPNYYSGSGEIQCPVCKTGTLRYSRASCNGHVHAACTSDRCARWME